MNLKSHFFFIFFSFCIISSLNAQNSCVVRINLQDCMTCLGQVTYLKDVSPNLSPIIVIEEKHKDYATKFLEHRLQLDPKVNKYLFSDKWYHQLSDKATSTIHILNEKEEVLYEGELKELANLLETINSYAGEKAKKLVYDTSINNEYQKKHQQQILAKLPNDITLSSKCKLKQNTNAYFVHDYLFNQIHKQTINTNTTTTLKAKEIDKEKLHKNVFGHSKHYRATIFYDEILTNLNQKDIIIESMQATSSSLYALVKIPYPVVETLNGNHNLIIKAQYALVEFDVVNFEQKEAFRLNAPKSSGYGIDPVSFEITNEGFQFGLFRIAWNDTNYFKANYSLTNNQLIFSNYVKTEVPTFFKEKNLVYEYFKNWTNQNFIFFEYGNVYVNRQTGKASLLPKEIVDFSSITDFKSFRVLAVTEQENQIQIIYKKEEKYYQAILANKKLLQNTPLYLLDIVQNAITKWQFLDWKHLIIVNSDNEIVKIPIEDSLSLQYERGNNKTATQ